MVVVAEVPVARLKIKSPSVRLPIEPVPKLKLVAKRLVEEAVVAKEFVVVALVVVELPVIIALPETTNFSDGFVRPIPTLPLEPTIVKAFVVASAPAEVDRKISNNPALLY